VKGVILCFAETHPGSDIMGDLPNHVLAHGHGYEVNPLRPCPPDLSGVLVEVGIDLCQVDGEPVSKASSSWNDKDTPAGRCAASYGCA